MITKEMVELMFYISIVVVGLTESLKKQYPSIPNWGKCLTALLLTAIAAVGYYFIAHPAILTAVIVGIGSFGFGQFNYNFVLKVFTALKNKLTPAGDEDEFADKVADKVIEEINGEITGGKIIG